MGCFYVNYTLRGVSQNSVVKSLKGRNAFVSPVHGDCLVVSEKESDRQDQKLIRKFAANLSATLHCPVLALLIHDDDILWFELYEDGSLSDQYDSNPSYFSGTSPKLPPAGGDAQKLCSVFESGTPSAVEQILREHSTRKYVFASDRHAALIKELSLPPFARGCCFAGILQGYPEDVDLDEFIETK